MANFPTKKKRGGGPLGLATPPDVTEIKNNLDQPEHAPAKEEPPVTGKRQKTNRTIPFTTKITPDFDTDLRQVAFDHRKTMGEILETAFYYWKKENNL